MVQPLIASLEICKREDSSNSAQRKEHHCCPEGQIRFGIYANLSSSFRGGKERRLTRYTRSRSIAWLRSPKRLTGPSVPRDRPFQRRFKAIEVEAQEKSRFLLAGTGPCYSDRLAASTRTPRCGTL